MSGPPGTLRGKTTLIGGSPLPPGGPEPPAELTADPVTLRGPGTSRPTWGRATQKLASPIPVAPEPATHAAAPDPVVSAPPASPSKWPLPEGKQVMGYRSGTSDPAAASAPSAGQLRRATPVGSEMGSPGSYSYRPGPDGRLHPSTEPPLNPHLEARRGRPSSPNASLLESPGAYHLRPDADEWVNPIAIPGAPALPGGLSSVTAPSQPRSSGKISTAPIVDVDRPVKTAVELRESEPPPTPFLASPERHSRPPFPLDLNRLHSEPPPTPYLASPPPQASTGSDRLSRPPSITPFDTGWESGDAEGTRHQVPMPFDLKGGGDSAEDDGQPRPVPFDLGRVSIKPGGTAELPLPGQPIARPPLQSEPIREITLGPPVPVLSAGPEPSPDPAAQFDSNPPSLPILDEPLPPPAPVSSDPANPRVVRVRTIEILGEPPMEDLASQFASQGSSQFASNGSSQLGPNGSSQLGPNAPSPIATETGTPRSVSVLEPLADHDPVRAYPQLPSAAPFAGGDKPIPVRQRKGRMSKAAYRLVAYGGVLLAVGLGVFLSRNPTMAHLAWFSSLMLLPIMLSQLVLIHRTWEAIQDGQARTSPGKAVGLLLVPLFQLYWGFQVYAGYATDFNRFIERYNVNTRPLSQNLILTAMVVPGAGLVLWWIIMGRFCDGVNAIRAQVERTQGNRPER